MNAVETRSLSFSYRGQVIPVLDNIDFTLDQGKIAAITGPSGSGKSTLGYCLCGVIPDLIAGEFSGTVKKAGRVGIVFQDPDHQLFLPTVEDELAFGPENLGLPREEIGERIEGVLELLGLTALRYENPARLSGGQKQLAALAGVLTLDPDVIILDETLSPLDTVARDRVKKVLLNLKQQGKALILIEHEKNNYVIADEIWQLKKGSLKKLPPYQEGDAHD